MAATAEPGRQRLPRQAVLFGAVSFLNDFASEMVYPLIPALVVGVLGGGAQALGALDGAAELAASYVKFAAGRLADRERRRGPLIVGGYAVAVAVRPVIAFAGAAWQVIALRVVDRIGKGLRSPPRDALIADVTPPALHGRAFGLQRGLDHAGAVVGPLVAWYLLAHHAAGIRTVIEASILPGLAVMVLAVVAVRRTDLRSGGQRAAGVASPASSVRPPERRTALYFIVAFYALRMPETLVILRSQELGVSVASVLLLWAALHVVRSASSFLGGSLNDRAGAERTMGLGWIASALVTAGFALADGPAAAWALFLALGVVAGLTESPERALVSRLRTEVRGRGFGTYHALTGLAALGGAVALGAAYQRWGAAAAFGASAGAGMLLAIGGPAALRRAA
ncbi:MAG TPA: MFS transporter [Gemmatimonadales bacterium]